MKKTFTFGKTNNNSKNFFLSGNNTDYSSILDSIIAADIIKKNSYLLDYNGYLDDLILTAKPTKTDNSKLNAAAKFLANYKTYTKTYKIPFTLNKMYTLSDGTPIIFYDDEFQIGFDTYKYSSFSDLSFLNGLSANTKKIIINIYTTGATNININLI